MITTRTILIDQGYNEVMGNLLGLQNIHTEVGLPEGGKTSGDSSMDELVDYAAANEFGDESNKNPPERSFIRSATDENRGEIFRRAEVGVNSIIALAMRPRTLLQNLGESLVLMIKAKIQGGPFAPLSEVTVARKGHDMPLVETGQLFETIQHKEVLKGV